MTDEPFEFEPGETYADLSIAIATRGAEIHGTVYDSNEPASDASVVVFATDRSKWFRQSRFLRTAKPDQDGVFSIQGLPAADYYVVAVDGFEASGAAGEWQDPEVLESVRAKARVITLGESGRATLKLTLTHR